MESLIFLALVPFTFFSQSNTNSMKEKIIYSAVLIAIGTLGLIAGKKLKEAKRWAWITVITFSFLTLGSPFLPFSALAIYFLFKKNSVMYFTLPHIPNKNGANQSR